MVDAARHPLALRPPRRRSSRGTSRGPVGLTSSPTLPGGHGSPVSTSTMATSSVSGPSEPSGVSGVRAIATPPSVEPNPSTTNTPNRSREPGQVAGRALVAVHELQRIVGVVVARRGGQDVGQRLADVVGVGGAVAPDVGDEPRRGELAPQRNRRRPRRPRPPSPPSPRWSGTAASTGRTCRRDRARIASASIRPGKATLSCVTRTALGSPLVPEVKISMNRSSGLGSANVDRRAAVCRRVRLPTAVIRRRRCVDAVGNACRVVGEDQLAVGTCDVTGEGVTAAGRVEPDRAPARPAPAATSTVEKNGVLPSSTPTCGGLAGSSRATSAAASSAPAWMWSRQLTNESALVHTAIGDVDERRQQLGDGRAWRSGHLTPSVRRASRPVRGRCAAAAPVAPPTANSVCLAARK